MKVFEVTQGQMTAGKIKRSNANEVEVEDPNNPGVTTKIDLRKAAVTQDEEGNTIVTPNSKQPKGPNKMAPGQDIQISNET